MLYVSTFQLKMVVCISILGCLQVSDWTGIAPVFLVLNYPLTTFDKYYYIPPASECSVLVFMEADCGRSQKHSRDHLLYTRKTSAQLLMRSTKYKGNDIILT